MMRARHEGETDLMFHIRLPLARRISAPASILATGLGAALAAGIAAAPGAPARAQIAGVPAPAHACQRACLEDYVERYLQAMAEQRVSDKLFARDVRFTENGVELPLGNEGLWATTSAPEGYRLIVPDVASQQVTALVTVQEQAGTSATGPQRPPEPVGISLRLRINPEGRISEIEQIAARPERPLGPGAAPASGPFGNTGRAVEALGAPWEGYARPVPEGERHTRAELVAVANAYFDAVERNDGKGYYPFTDDCLRYENGILAAAPQAAQVGSIGPRLGCREQLETSLFGTVTSIRDRRFVAVDEERGIVFAFAFFDHRPINWSWQLGELFKIENGKISRIEAIFIRGPYGMCSGWSTYAQCRSEAIQDIR